MKAHSLKQVFAKAGRISTLIGTGLILMALSSCAVDPVKLGRPASQSELNAKWSKLEQGMERSEVLELLGRPSRLIVDDVHFKKVWIYPFGHVVFEPEDLAEGFPLAYWSRSPRYTGPQYGSGLTYDVEVYDLVHDLYF